MKRFLGLVLSVVVLSTSVFIVPASAVSYSGAATLDNWHAQSSTSNIYYNSMDIVLPYTGYYESDTKERYVGFKALEIDVDIMSPFGLYVSYYIDNSGSTPESPVTLNSPYDSASYEMRYQSSVSDGGVGPVELQTFTSSGNPSFYDGITLIAKGNADEELPLNHVELVNPAQSLFYATTSTTKISYIRYTSVRLITTESSADLEALEGIASEIAEQTDILQAMYGDIIAICNSIYQRCGDMLVAQNLTNQYFSSIIPVLNSIDTNTGNIYTLLQAQFSLLISTIQNESNNIQSAIDSAEKALEAYLDSVFSGAVGSLPGQTGDLNESMEYNDSQETQWQNSVTENFEALDINNFAFPAGIISGFGVVTSVFGSLWGKLGSSEALYTFPLFLGICLLLIGRLSKFAGRQGSSHNDKGGDDA